MVAHDIPSETHAYAARPYFNETLGIWLSVTPTGLLAAVLAGWGTAALAASLLLVAVGVAEVVLDIPVVSRFGAARQENIIVQVPPAGPARQEVVLSAHFDTKTEFLDHEKRRVFTATLAPAMALCLLVGVGAWAAGGPAAASWGAQPWVRPALAAAAGAVLVFGWGMGLNLATGRLLPRQSSGAVDNGGSCAVLMELARRLAAGDLGLKRTAVTIALFSGEEVTMQGSRAYVRSRSWPLPVAAVNLECLGQRGGYHTWDADGTVLRRVPTDPALGALVREAAQAVTGQPCGRTGFSNTDAYAFLAAGLPAAGLASSDPEYALAGLHGSADVEVRISLERLNEAATVLSQILIMLDSGLLPQTV